MPGKLFLLLFLAALLPYLLRTAPSAARNSRAAKARVRLFLFVITVFILIIIKQLI